MTKSIFNVRSLTEPEYKKFTALARQRQTSLSELAGDLIRREIEASDPQLCLGWFEPARPGDLGPEDDCPMCHFPLGWPYYVAKMADGSVFGPVCSDCGNSK